MEHKQLQLEEGANVFGRHPLFDPVAKEVQERST